MSIPPPVSMPTTPTTPTTPASRLFSLFRRRSTAFACLSAISLFLLQATPLSPPFTSLRLALLAGVQFLLLLALGCTKAPRAPGQADLLYIFSGISFITLSLAVSSVDAVFRNTLVSRDWSGLLSWNLTCVFVGVPVTVVAAFAFICACLVRNDPVDLGTVGSAADMWIGRFKRVATNVDHILSAIRD
ncbi:hypothetical protein FB451DRAFT_1165817 [Mycena latifolia]|nr:hypothetical protein FB451DRAFT_1165817 [Mycena latifolia]